MTTFALDTNIVSYFLRQNQDIYNKIDYELSRGNDIVIPPIVYFEIRRGLLYANAPVKLSAFEQLCANLNIGIITKETLDIAAALYADKRKEGKTLEDADLLIAAYCIYNGCTLVTNNIKHFKAIKDLNIENWTT
jgi:predicted nucleic acid-binding protein